jgi:uncharacterized protein
MNRILNETLESKRAALESVCAKHGVASLDLFGAGTTDEWNPADGDLDFVVVFRADDNPGIADRYLGLAEALEDLFSRPVNLITAGAIRNPYFRDHVNSTRSRIYAR